MTEDRLTPLQIQAFARHLRLEEKSEATMEKYLRDIRAFARWLDGREIGSYVIPECENKFYVTASVDERARRRLLELKEKGGDNGMTVEDMAKDIAERDYNDSHRAFAPLLRLPEAILIDTTDLTIDEAVNAVLKNLKNIGAEAHK